MNREFKEGPGRTLKRNRFSPDTSNACGDNRPKEMKNHLELRCDKKVVGQGSVLKNLRAPINNQSARGLLA